MSKKSGFGWWCHFWRNMSPFRTNVKGGWFIGGAYLGAIGKN